MGLVAVWQLWIHVCMYVLMYESVAHLYLKVWLITKYYRRSLRILIEQFRESK